MPSIPTIDNALAAIKTDESKILGLTIGEHKVTPGLHIPKARSCSQSHFKKKQPKQFFQIGSWFLANTTPEARSNPEISFPGGAPDTTYLCICLDTDAPFVSLPFLSPILHWLQTDLVITTPSAGLLTSTTTPLCTYAPPGPPPISGPHRYIFLLFKQPEGFDAEKFKSKTAPEVPVKERMWYDFGGFEKGAGVGEVVAVNYFTSN